MDFNPWRVESIQEFSFLKCPECPFDSKEEDAFENHAIENHPLSFILFVKAVKEECYEDPLQIKEVHEKQNIDNSNTHIDFVHEEKKLETTQFYVIPPQNRFSKYEESSTEYVEDCDQEIPSISTEIKIEEVEELDTEMRENVHEGNNQNVNDNKKYQCSFCDKSYADIFSLERHVKSIHEGKKPFHCTKCDARFSQIHGLKDHIAIIHEKKKPHKCAICNSSFSMTRHLIRHELSKHGNKTHVCSICGTSFGLKEMLDRHIREVHQKKETRKCSMCYSSFSNVGNLNKHMARVHEGKKFKRNVKKMHNFIPNAS